VSLFQRHKEFGTWWTVFFCFHSVWLKCIQAVCIKPSLYVLCHLTSAPPAQSYLMTLVPLIHFRNLCPWIPIASFFSTILCPGYIAFWLRIFMFSKLLILKMSYADHSKGTGLTGKLVGNLESSSPCPGPAISQIPAALSAQASLKRTVLTLTVFSAHFLSHIACISGSSISVNSYQPASRSLWTNQMILYFCLCD
jgi:hypothetical protein